MMRGGAMAYERWMYADPMLALERKQEREARSKHGRRERAKAGLEALFEGDEDMARRLDVPPHVTAALHQWGDWANRPQFWANLNVTPFCKLIGIGHGRPLPDIKLDPQSMRIHKAFSRMRCRVTRLILIGYYVAGENWDSKEHVYEMFGIHSREYFNTVLKRGSLSLYNAAKIGGD